jgi:hypothetical protein
MNIDKIIEQWEEKHSSLLDEYSKGNANNEVMQMYRSQMKNVLDFINQLKQVKNCFIPDVSCSLNFFEQELNRVQNNIDNVGYDVPKLTQLRKDKEVILKSIQYLKKLNNN